MNQKKHEITLLFFLILSLFSCELRYNQEYKLAPEMEVNTSDKLLVTISHDTVSFIDTIFPLSYANLYDDKLTINLIYNAGGWHGNNIIIDIKADTFHTHFDDWSDVHRYVYKTTGQELTISKFEAQIGDTIYGILKYKGVMPKREYMTSDLIAEFETSFKCIVRPPYFDYNNVYTEWYLNYLLREKQPDTIKELHLENGNLFEIPEEISLFKNVSELYLENNNLSEINIELLSKLHNLKILNLSRNKIEKIPSNISILKNLEVLSFTENNIDTIDPVLFELENLKILWFEHNDYTEFPEGISKLNGLEVVSFSDNMRSLPKDISALKNIKEIYLPDSLDRIPAGIFKNKTLKKVMMSFHTYQNSKDIIPYLRKLEEVVIWIHECDAWQYGKEIRSTLPNVRIQKYGYCG
jgi:hypothetical protein